MNRFLRIFGIFSVLLFALAACASTTLENLQTAYNGESNAHVRYLAFAKQADEEGFPQAAALFRAAARAEEVHASNHAAVIKHMGAEPKADIQTPVVKSTKQNLKTAIEGETYEKDVMYPDFLKQARADNNAEAIQTFTYARTAEAGHAKLYTNASENLGNMKAKGITYQVCSICGYTVPKANFPNCPSCLNPVEKYETIA